MNKPKTPVVKSNSTSETKKNTQKNNKKSRSDAEFQSKTEIRSEGVLKRRGVYVEKKVTKMSIKDINNRDPSPEALPNKPQTFPPRIIPRPGRKRFLASVLTILSQSTTGTQCPDITDRLRKMAKTKPKRRKSKGGDNQENSITSSNNSKAKPRYRSRILNNYADSEIDQVVVLNSTKEIKSSSNEFDCVCGKDSISTSIDRGTVTWAHGLAPLNQNNLDTTAPKATRSKRENENEPTTIVADLPNKNEKNSTTFSAYNMKTELNQQLPTSANSSKVKLEIDESGVRNIKKTYGTSRSPSPKYYYSIMPDKRQQWYDRELLEHEPKYSKLSRIPERNRKLKSKSFNYEKVTPFPKTTSFTTPHKKKVLKKDPKKEFINMLKTQLLMKADTYEEPQNFFQALKVISRNKRRSQKSMHSGSAVRPSEGDVHVCQFKRRKVLSGKSSGKQSRYYPDTRSDSITPNYVSHKKRTVMNTPEKYSEEDLSSHSIEVIGYDYQPTQILKDWEPSPPTPESTIAVLGLYGPH